MILLISDSYLCTIYSIPLFKILFRLMLDSSRFLVLLYSVITSSDIQFVSFVELGKFESCLAYFRCFLSLRLLASRVSILSLRCNGSDMV